MNIADIEATKNGINWLLGIQNSNGGFPTFCKGWGKLPFDASCPDITAHAIRAMVSWIDVVDDNSKKKINTSITKAKTYLSKNQRNDGSWLPLWFGNENEPNHLNPVYGTSQVLIGLRSIENENIKDNIKRGCGFLLSAQNSDGGWGGNKNVPSSIEETSLALRALAVNGYKSEIGKSIVWLIERLENVDKEGITATPIGLYFASLWYYEDMYPYVFANAALTEITSSL